MCSCGGGCCVQDGPPSAGQSRARTAYCCVFMCIWPEHIRVCAGASGEGGKRIIHGDRVAGWRDIFARGTPPPRPGVFDGRRIVRG